MDKIRRQKANADRKHEEPSSLGRLMRTFKHEDRTKLLSGLLGDYGASPSLVIAVDRVGVV